MITQQHQTEKPRPAFHQGELEAQRLAKVSDVASLADAFIRDHMPEQHRDFFASLPFLVVTGGDAEGHPWVSLFEGPAGFAVSPDTRRLSIASQLHHDDPIANAFARGSKIGILGIELATRRRNRLNGKAFPSERGLVVEVEQCFGNCPQYIRQRAWEHVGRRDTKTALKSDRLDLDQQARVKNSDTFFVGSGRRAGGSLHTDGYDASHRGGAKGFVSVTDNGTQLHFPDYAGNNYFNTIGNLLDDPRIGLLFVDFATGNLLHIAGTARVEWQPEHSPDPDALRMIHVAIEKVIDRPGASALRWSEPAAAKIALKVIDKVKESDLVTSFHLAPHDGVSLPPFKPGQYLPIELDVPGHAGCVTRTYSLSGPATRQIYRISVKREKRGLASTFLHKQIRVGDTMVAYPPAGEFILPDGDRPVVLASVGVGITPMIPMLHAAIKASPSRRIYFAHGARDGLNHSFGFEVDEMVAQNTSVRRKIFYSHPRDSDVEGRDFDVRGRIDAHSLLNFGGGADADYILCGPAGFIAVIRNDLEACGVPSTQIHYETFGPSS